MKLMTNLVSKVFLLLFCSFCAVTLDAQQSSKNPILKEAAETLPITTSEMNSTLIAEEQNYVQQVLVIQGVEFQDIILHASYNQLLSSIQNEWSANFELQKKGLMDFEKVLDDAQADTALKYQHLLTLRQHFNGLRENLAIIGQPKSKGN